MKNDLMMAKIIQLNKRESLPDSGLKRNSVHYPLISYINNSISLFISESYDDVALFFKRADDEISILNQKNLSHVEYFSLCDDYMRSVSKFLITHNYLSESGLELIPHKYKCDPNIIG